ncbi:hypothetical protein MCAV_05930 [[Mycoplasma] cavipharyngis]
MVFLLHSLLSNKTKVINNFLIKINFFSYNTFLLIVVLI